MVRTYVCTLAPIATSCSSMNHLQPSSEGASLHPGLVDHLDERHYSKAQSYVYATSRHNQWQGRELDDARIK